MATQWGYRPRYSYVKHDNRWYLTGVDYSDGTHALYTWDFGANPVYMKSADDSHYSGAMRHIEYGSHNHINGEWKQWTSNNNSTLVSGLDTNFENDGNGNYVRTEKRGDDATRSFTYKKDIVEGCSDPPEGQPHPNHCLGPFFGYLLKYTDFNGKLTTIEYYDSQYIRAVTDANGNVTEYVRNYTGQNGSWAITKIIYHPPEHANLATCGGNSNPCNDPFIEQSFTPDPGTTDHHKYPYYLASRTALRKPGDAAHTTSFTRNPATAPNPNAVIRIDYPDGGSETFTYNAKGQVLTHRLKNSAYEHFEYDSNWRLINKWNPTWSSTPLPNDPKVSYTYYGPNDHPAWSERVKTETLPANGSGFQASNTYEYDREFVTEPEFGFPTNSGNERAGRGLVTKITHADGTFQQFRHNSFGDKIWEKNEMGQRTVYTYDEYGRVTNVKDPLDNLATSSYVKWGQTSSYVTTSSLPFVTTLPSGKQTYFYYDANWRKDHVTQAPNTADAATTWFTYDDVGNLETQTNPRGKITTYFYDWLNRVTDVDDPMVNASPVAHQNSRGHTISYDYYGTGMKEREIRANDQEIHYDQYDSMNRLLQVTTHRDATYADVRSMTYDWAGNIRTRTDERGNVYTYGYDEANRKVMLLYPRVGQHGLAVYEEWSYDAAGNVRTSKTRANQVATFGYDNRNRQTSATWSDIPPQ